MEKVCSKRMKAANETAIKVNANGYRFTASTSKLVFKGYLSVYKQVEKEEQTDEVLATLNKDSKLKFNLNIQHFTKPAHYNEA